MRIIKMKINLHRGFCCDRFSFSHAGLKPPLLNCLYGFLIETHAQANDHVNIARNAICSHSQNENALPLKVRFAGACRIVGLW